MQVNFTPEEEARLAQLAANAGTNAERLVKNIILNLLEDKADFTAAEELPVWHLGSVGPFHRRDIYHDVH